MKKILSNSLSIILSISIALSGSSISASAQEDASTVDQAAWLVNDAVEIDSTSPYEAESAPETVIMESAADPGSSSTESIDADEVMITDITESDGEMFLDDNNVNQTIINDDTLSDADAASSGDMIISLSEEDYAMESENDAVMPDASNVTENLGAATGVMFSQFLSQAVVKTGTEAISLNSEGTVTGQLYTLTNSTKLYLYVSGSGTDILKDLNATSYSAYVSEITDIIIEEGIINIGVNSTKPDQSVNSVFSSCSSLTTVHFPSTLRQIGNSAFQGCSKLTSVTFSAGTKLQSIGSHAFHGCGFSAFDIPSPAAANSIIDSSAFAYCNNLAMFSVPAGIKVIGENAFIGCAKLDTVIMPVSLTKIGASIFNPGTIKYVYYTGASSKWKKIDIQAGNERWNPDKVIFGVKNVTGITITDGEDYYPIINDNMTSSTQLESMQVTITPADAVNKNITVTTSNSGVVSISPTTGKADSDGNFRVVLTIRKQTFNNTVKSRTATVRFTTSDGGYYAECVVLIKGKDTAEAPTLDGLAGAPTTTQTSKLPSVTMYEGERHCLTSATPDAQIFYTFDKAVTQSNRWASAIVYDSATGYYKVDESYTNKYKYTIYEYTDALVGGKTPGFATTFNATPMYVIAIKKDMNFSSFTSGTFAVSYPGPKVVISEQGDILDEDLPSGGVSAVPAKDVWIPEWQLRDSEKSRIYNGNNITIKNLRVYYGNELLSSGVDYAVTYSNNINAGDMGEDYATAPCVKVKLTGNYSGAKDFRFTIHPRSLKDVAYSFTQLYLPKQDVAQTPDLNITADGLSLEMKKDYTIYYSPLSGTESATYLTAIPANSEGYFAARITGIGNYCDTIFIPTGGDKIPIYIYAIEEDAVQVPISKATVGKIPSMAVADASAFDPMDFDQFPVYYLKNKISTYAYTAAIKNNTRPGTATIVLTGTGRTFYVGEQKTCFVGTRSITFKVTGTPMNSKPIVIYYNNKAITNAYPNDKVYTGSEITLADKLKVIDTSVSKVMEEGIDYSIAYSNNVKAGTATITFTGMGTYVSSTKRVFSIKKRELTESMISFPQKDYDYSSTGVKPTVVVSIGDVTLRENTDYTLSYPKNKKVGAYEITIKPKGSLSGSKIIKGYNINKVPISDCQISVPDRTATNKPGSDMSTPTIYDRYGKRLSPGKDYSKSFIYTYAEDTMITRNNRLILATKDEEVEKSDIVYKGSSIKITVNGLGNYTQSISAVYRIAKTNLSTLKFSIDPQPYTGYAIQPGKSQISISGFNSKYDEAKAYDIVSYGENTKAGTGTIVIKGINDYAGTMTLKFTISKR